MGRILHSLLLLLLAVARNLLADTRQLQEVP